ESKTPQRKLDFPLNLLVNTMPQKASLNTIPLKSDQLAYRAYLVNAAACYDCHTQSEKGEYKEGMDFAGGTAYQLPSGTVYSANITPDIKTGIGSWTKEQFISRFKMYADSSYHLATLKQDDFQTIIPWMMYGGMENEDLEAIYVYLKTVKPIKNKV